MQHLTRLKRIQHADPPPLQWCILFFTVNNTKLHWTDFKFSHLKIAPPVFGRKTKEIVYKSEMSEAAPPPEAKKKIKKKKIVKKKKKLDASISDQEVELDEGNTPVRLASATKRATFSN
jgi:hypothetical protein